MTYSFALFRFLFQQCSLNKQKPIACFDADTEIGFNLRGVYVLKQDDLILPSWLQSENIKVGI